MVSSLNQTTSMPLTDHSKHVVMAKDGGPGYAPSLLYNKAGVLEQVYQGTSPTRLSQFPNSKSSQVSGYGLQLTMSNRRWLERLSSVSAMEQESVCFTRKKKKKESLRASKTAQQVKVLATEPDLPEFHTWNPHNGRKKQAPESCSLTSIHTCTCTHTELKLEA